MRRTVRLFAGILICAAVVPAWSQADWQGSAAVGTSDEFPSDGLYAASSAFPLNSTVDVTNPATGEQARVEIVRGLDDPGVFMVVSETVANELNLKPGNSTTVRATPVQPPGLTAISPNQDLPFHPDPDVNPAASFGDPNAALVMPPRREEPADAVQEVEPAPAEEGAVADGGPDESTSDEETPDQRDEASPEDTEPEERELRVAEVDVPEDEDATEERSTGDRETDTAGEGDTEPDEPDEPDEADEREGDLDEPVPSVTIPVTPPESEPLPITELEVPEASVEEFETELSDPEVRIVVDVPEPTQPPANPVRVVPTISADTDESPRISEAESAETSEPAEGEVALPLVPEDEVEARVADREPDADTAIAPIPEEDEPLRPDMIPDDAIVSLEPADFRSPDPPPEPAPAPEERDSEPTEDMDGDSEAIASPQPAESGSDTEGDPPSEPEAEPAPDSDPSRAATDAPATEGDPAGSLPLVEELDGEAAYVQVAAFSTPQSVRRTIDTLSGGWPVAVMAQKNGDRSVYRVYVGPLAEDEKGSVLFRVRNQGFRDAFVR
ncbi:MAG: SPOR domain-containing protein [Alkalispirochaeta sp.]